MQLLFDFLRRPEYNIKGLCDASGANFQVVHQALKGHKKSLPPAHAWSIFHYLAPFYFYGYQIESDGSEIHTYRVIKKDRIYEDVLGEESAFFEYSLRSEKGIITDKDELKGFINSLSV